MKPCLVIVLLFIKSMDTATDRAWKFGTTASNIPENFNNSLSLNPIKYFENFSEMITDIMSGLQSFLPTLGNTFLNSFRILVKQLSSCVTLILNTITYVDNVIKEQISRLSQALETHITGWFKVVKDKASNCSDEIQTEAEQLISSHAETSRLLLSGCMEDGLGELEELESRSVDLKLKYERLTMQAMKRIEECNKLSAIWRLWDCTKDIRGISSNLASAPDEFTAINEEILEAGTRYIPEEHCTTVLERIFSTVNNYINKIDNLINDKCLPNTTTTAERPPTSSETEKTTEDSTETDSLTSIIEQSQEVSTPGENSAPSEAE